MLRTLYENTACKERHRLVSDAIYSSPGRAKVYANVAAASALAIPLHGTIAIFLGILKCHESVVLDSVL